MTTNDILKEVVKDSGMRQIRIAEQTGLGKAWISLLLKNKNELKFSTLQNIAERIGYEVVITWRKKK